MVSRFSTRPTLPPLSTAAHYTLYATILFLSILLYKVPPGQYLVAIRKKSFCRFINPKNIDCSGPKVTLVPTIQSSSLHRSTMECMKDGFREDQLLDGRFRTIAPLNHGSFGMVFLAEDTQTRQEVAIKCLTKPSIANSGSSALTADEGAEELACHAILKHHDHLVNLVHHFDTEAHTYLVLEYCSQGDLYEAIRLDHGPLQTEHVRRFMLQLISAVQHMHAHGL